jgi:sulfate/thiosulfate transport system ATP-binding protein
MSAGIVVQGLTKRFGTFTAVDDVSFEARDGAITALLGPSGSGKSTVLRMIAGLEYPDKGRIWVGGEELTARSVQERRLGFVFQHYALFRHMTVEQNIAFGLSVRKRSRVEQRQRVTELLELVGLQAFADRYPEQLSGGQRQRVALARALAPRPSVLLLDEPFGALDAQVRQELRRWLDQLHRELGVTGLLVTHDQEEALELAGEIVVMHRGLVEQMGSPEDIYNRPASPFVANFVGASNTLRGAVWEGHVHFGQAAVAGAHLLDDGLDAVAYVRPHDVGLRRKPEDLAFAVDIERRTDLGWMSKFHLRLADGQLLIADIPNDEANGLNSGEEAWAVLRNAKVFPATDPKAAAAPTMEDDLVRT